MIAFKHKIFQFTPEGILSQLGLTPASGPLYYSFLTEVTSIIETQVQLSAERLNGLLKEAYRKDMSMISEYNMFPDYIKVMENALSQSRHTGTYRDEIGLVQAKFIDTDVLGDIGDLQRIQKTVHKGGSLLGWIRIYNSWLEGRSDEYEDIVNARIGMMLSESIAPFWRLVEDGNGSYAYPRNGPFRTLTAFNSTYIREMKAAYQRTLSAVRALVVRPTPFIGYGIATVEYSNKTFAGYSWLSNKGTTIFAISGTTMVDRLGHLTGRGFVLDKTGGVLRKWAGWLPK